MAHSHKYGSLAGVLWGALLAMVLAAAAHAEVTQDFHRTVPFPPMAGSRSATSMAMWKSPDGSATKCRSTR